MDAGYRATGLELSFGFGEDALAAFVTGMERVLGRIRGAGDSDGSR